MLLRCTLACFLYILATNCRSDKKQLSIAGRNDTLGVYKTMLNYPEFGRYIANNPLDTIYIIKNEHFRKDYKLNLPRKKIILAEKPSGYPKFGKFDFYKLQISFEQIKINADTATGFCLIKGMGLLGKFKLSKINGEWTVTGYEKIMI